jgi:hypothetical protein
MTRPLYKSRIVRGGLMPDDRLADRRGACELVRDLAPLVDTVRQSLSFALIRRAASGLASLGPHASGLTPQASGLGGVHRKVTNQGEEKEKP